MFLVFFKFVVGYSQQYEVNLSPEGKLETVYDNQGKQYKLKDILIEAPIDLGVSRATTITCSTTSYFNLYFEPGCGMENTSIPAHNARRAVICKVFEDLSNFITSPLSTTGNKVNIWVRNIANENAPAGTLGLASSYYLPSPNVGGILDGEIWKTIHLGVDSYTSVLNGTNLFYHGRVSFNFNDPSINWNTNLSVNSPSNLYDLYTVILHEVVHSLGFGSFINQNGNSIDPFPYYSRYDTFLRTNNNIPLLTIGSCSMYDLSFNTAVSPTVLRPGCTLPNNESNGVLNITNCNDAIKYVGSSTVPVYTPTCFEQGSSLGHFEDMLFPTCANPNGNDNYFVLSNANSVGITKRYLKPEERNVLCDIGYNVNTTFGATSTSSGYYNYGGTPCAGISVAGLNDGINSNGDYTFTGNINTNITINGATILNNDVNATGFECLQDISSPSTLSVTSGTSSTSINFFSANSGMHILRYVPINGTQRGNITYIYVYIRVPASLGGCSPIPSACNLVMNGDFEQFSNAVFPLVKKACGWDTVGSSSLSSYSNSLPNSNSNGVPCNWLGNQSCNNNLGNGFVGIFVSTGIYGKQHLYTTLKTPLQASTNYQLSFDVSLADGFSHWASNLQAFLHRSNSTPPSILAYNSNGDVSIVNNAFDLTTQLISPTVTRNTNGWDTITFNFTTTTGGEQFLYLGLLNQASLVSNTPAPTGIGGCSYQSAATNAFGNELISYYIDNVSLIPTNGVIFDLPNDIDCNTQLSSDLTDYVSGAPANGTFSGNGIVFSPSDGTYSFNPQLAGNGLTTLTYTYTNANGCLVSINTVENVIIDNPEISGVTSICLGTIETFTADVGGGTWSTSNTTIADINPITGELDAYQAGAVDVIYTNVSGNCNFITQLQVTIIDSHMPPVFSFPTTICLGGVRPNLPNMSDDGIHGFWDPDTVDNSATADYTFYPDNNCSNPFIQTVTVINGGTLVANQDTMFLPYSPTGFLSPNILLNDTLDGNPLTSNFLGLDIILVTTSHGITLNQDGTLNIPPDLPIGVYTIEYYLKNDCLQSDVVRVDITIYDATIIADDKTEINVCYSQSAYTTTESIFEKVYIGGLRADATTIDINNLTTPSGFSLNTDGTINVPTNTLPGTYNLNYNLCPIGSNIGCVNDITFQVIVNTTIRANPDIFYFDTDGNFIGSNNSTNTNNILTNDGYAQDCGFSAPNSFGPVVLGGNISNLTVTPLGLTASNFIINSNGFISSYGNVNFGTYSFTYNICDADYQNIICSSITSWISVIPPFARIMSTTNSIKELDNEIISIMPNPSDGIFHLRFDNKNKEEFSIEVYNLMGQLIFIDKNINVDNYEINLSNNSSGTYLLKIFNIDKTISKKLIVK